MGSYSETNGYNIDPTEGGLVWVRRRNGSWWPGRILCPDKLPQSYLYSPRRSGAPVQLLGREDASVEWYNLEKSKRVKPFRCGEYDECIEKARAIATISCKKALKYAHREDAILQALELENCQSPKNNDPDTISQTDKKENVSDKMSALDFISISPQELSRTVTSAVDYLNDSEDDGTEGSMKCMRGLEDLGIGMAYSSFKKKQSRVVHIHDVLEKTTMVTVPVMCEELTGLYGPGFSVNKVSHSMDDVVDNGNDANNCKQKDDENPSDLELLQNEDSSGRLFDVPFIQEEMHTAGPSPGLVPLVTGRVDVTVSMEPDEFQESSSISSGMDIKHIMDNGTSKWQNKGKRNSRNKTKTKAVQKILDPDDELKQVNNMVDLMAPQRSMPIRQARLKKTELGTLYDVNIEVKAGHFTKQLPYISLLSNFTRQPITGHSLEVEVLNDTGSDTSLNSFECLSSSCELGAVNKVNGDAEMVLEASKKPRKNGLLSNKKTRRLSSLMSSKGSSETRMLKKPDLACVPLKVVFSRIYAALGVSSADAVQDR